MFCLIELNPLLATDGSRPTLRACSAQDPRLTGANGERWLPAISKAPSLGMKLFDGDFSSAVDPGTATFTVKLDILALSGVDVGQCRWAGAKIAISAAPGLTMTDRGTAEAATSVVFNGIVDSFTTDANALVVTAKIDTSPFDADALPLTYAGTSGVEGGPDLKGQLKPWILGNALNVEPKLIDSDNSVFQFSAYGPISEVVALYERGSPFGDSVGDFADYDALVAADIPAGRWGTCVTQGLVRLGAPPYGVITGDVEGDRPAANDYPRLTGAIIKRVATNAGVALDQLDIDSLDGLDAAVPYPVNIVLTEQTSVLELAQRLARPCNAQAGVGWTGKLFVTRVALSDSMMTLDAAGRRLPPVQKSTESNVSPPYKRIQMGAQRCWRVQTLDEIAFEATLVDRGLYDANTTYREGNIVELQDGSRWLYVSTAPGKGHAPASGSTYWTMMVPATTPVGPDGQPLISLIDAAAALASGKTTLFYQATPPSAAESAPNDQWINTGAGNIALIRVAGTGRLAIGGNAITIGGNYITLPWVEAPDQRIATALSKAAGAQATADGKVEAFVLRSASDPVPNGDGVGDLLFRLYLTPPQIDHWNGNAWVASATYGASAEQAAAIAASEAAIEAITSDNVLSRAEKPQFAREYSEAYARYSAINAKAATFGNVAAERAALTSAWNALSADVSAITPAYDDASADSPIVGDDLQAAWNAFYTAYAALDMAITAQTIAVQWSVDGAGGWHDGYAAGDKWQRQSTDGGASWSDPVKVVGEDGADGDQGPPGIPGTPGADGQTHYTWVAYADSADGTVNFTTGNPGSRAYLGLAANKTTAAESANAADYVWSKIVGPQGPQGDQGVRGPPGADGTPRYIWVAYADSADGTANFTTGPPGARTYIGVSPNQTAAVEGTDPAAYNWAKIQGPSGPHTSFVFKRAAAQPATPTATTTPPSGWSDAPPAQTDPATPLWQSQASFQDATRISDWSTPIKLTAASLADLDPAAADLLAEAKAVADGKATIFRQSTPPSAVESQPNDLWITTAAGNRTMVRVAGTGRLAIGGNAITLGGSYITLPWIEATDAQLGQALASAADAIGKAQTAQAAADSAASNIEALSDDGLLTGAEKQQVLIPQDAALDGAWTVLDAQAAGFAITTERTAATAARSAWQTYRNGLSPAWNDTTRATPVDRGTFRAKLDGYDGALRQLQAAISAAAAERAEWDLVSGDKPPSNSDNTAENQHYLGDTPTVVILADYQGTPLAGQLPAEVTVPRYLGSADVTADTDFAITTGSGVTATINNTAGDDQRGTITISVLTTLTGSIYVATSYEGVPLYRQIQIVRQDGNAPTGGGGTAGPVSTSELTSPGASTTHVTMTDVLSLQVGASGAIDASASITYHAVSSGTSSDGGLDAPESAMAVKWQYSADGSAGWTDLGAEQSGTGASYWFSIQPPKGPHDNPGSVSLAQSKTGLTPGATAYLRLVGRLATGTGISTVAGTATVAQQ